MEYKTLIQTNPYLRDPILREELISRSVRTSCGVEGITLSNNPVSIEIPRLREKGIHKAIGQ